MSANKSSSDTMDALRRQYGSGNFSTDRTIAEYAPDIWHVKPCPVP